MLAAKPTPKSLIEIFSFIISATGYIAPVKAQKKGKKKEEILNDEDTLTKNARFVNQL